jgi:glyceraldehyde 3-phosphate dehydrogenase
MSTRIAINGFGRIGRLALRAGWGWPELTFGHLNELKGDAATSAHLLTFDSVHGRWPHEVHGEGDTDAGRRAAQGSAAGARPASRSSPRPPARPPRSG